MEAEQMTVQWLAQEPPAIVVPVPTVVVEPQVTIPPELLERLAPVEASGLTQPWATLLAGFFVLVAALFAFGGVLYAQRVTRATTKAQLRQQRAAMIRQEKQLNEQLRVQQQLHDDAQERQAQQHAATLKGQLDLLRLQTHAETQKQTHQDVKEVILEAQAQLQEVHSAVAHGLGLKALGKTPDNTSVSWFAESFIACETSIKKFAILGLDDARAALEQAIGAFGISYMGETTDAVAEMQTLQDKYEAATTAFKLALIMTP